MNKIKQAIEESCIYLKSGHDVDPIVAQHHLLDVLVSEIDIMDAKDPSDVSYTQGYEKAIEDVISLIKEAKV